MSASTAQKLLPPAVPAATREPEFDDFDLDVTVLEIADPSVLVNMTDDGCGSTCEKSTCISSA